jgi:nucleoside-diphosphate-sugar epimerase
MPIIITGSQGNIGQRLMAAFPGAIGIDNHRDADIVADLSIIDYEARIVRQAFQAADGLIHLATSPNPDAPDEIHWTAVRNTVRLLDACRNHQIARVVLPSSDWAEPKPGFGDINAYGHSKRVLEALAGMYSMTPGLRCTALRIGWVPHDPSEVATATPWLAANYWPDERLLDAFRKALG